MKRSNNVRLCVVLSLCFLAATTLGGVIGCSPAPSGKVKKKITDLIGKKPKEYLVNFQNTQDAQAHSEQAKKLGARVQTLNSTGRTLLVQFPQAIENTLSVPEGTLASLNGRLHLKAPQHPKPARNERLLEENLEQLAEAVLTSREVVGVEKLIAEKPTADGRNVKVAVFDTGIDFGLKGIATDQSGERKLVGFYDLTDFGRVSPQKVEGGNLREIQVEGQKVIIEAKEVSSVATAGFLREKELTRFYLSGEPVDLNENGQTDESFVYLVGKDQAGTTVVLFDRDRDLLIESSEILYDYNTNYSYLDLRTDVAPSGARPLAVTIHSESDIQFHHVAHGHGTSCGMIIAGDGYADGRIRGMAPKAQLVSYVLDVMGQDVYTVAQFIQMFEHAKEQKVDAISISWGFSTADLASARFIADYLDREIASAGILIGIAAGNEGPGVSTATSDDYIPRKGMGVGAYLAQQQSENVYGWTGTPHSSMIWYSSFGPTRGGRQMPDIASPLATLVRRERSASGRQFYGFSGTSSATPAMIGAAAALISQIKQELGVDRVDPRLLKLALQNSAHPLESVMSIRQGAGLVDVSRALKIYQKLQSEVSMARESKEGRFAYELLASTPLRNSSTHAEGIRFIGFQPSAMISLRLSEESRQWVDALNFVEPLILQNQNETSTEKQSRFYSVPRSVALQSSGTEFSIAFDRKALTQPGVYEDTLLVKRPSDGLVLLRIPVVVEIPHTVQGQTLIHRIDQTVGALDQVRVPFELKQATSLRFDGEISDLDGNRSAVVGFLFKGAEGINFFDHFLPHPGSFTKVQFSTPVFPPGHYEMLVVRHFSRPAVLAPIHLSGSLKLPSVQVVAKRVLPDKVQVVLESADPIAFQMSELNLTHREVSIPLHKDLNATPRAGFFGEFDFGESVQEMSIGIRQSHFDFTAERMLHMSVALLNEQDDPTYRGWVNVEENQTPLQESALLYPVQKMKVVAYPNIVDWKTFQTSDLTLVARYRLSQEGTIQLSKAFKKAAVLSGDGNQLTLEFALDGKTLPTGEALGTLDLKDSAGQILETLEIRL